MQSCALISSLFDFITDPAKIFLSKKGNRKKKRFSHIEDQSWPTPSVLMTPKWQPHQRLIHTTSC